MTTRSSLGSAIANQLLCVQPVRLSRSGRDLPSNISLRSPATDAMSDPAAILRASSSRQALAVCSFIRLDFAESQRQRAQKVTDLFDE
jgi:hypothetical protein